jgi:hypothetical protein
MRWKWHRLAELDQRAHCKVGRSPSLTQRDSIGSNMSEAILGISFVKLDNLLHVQNSYVKFVIFTTSDVEDKRNSPHIQYTALC